MGKSCFRLKSTEGEVRVSDQQMDKKKFTVNVKNATERTVNVSLLPATHIILDGSTPQNLMFDHDI